ncbi:MAG: YaiO family outer membrane beta-barrel protein [Zetaproteobacteria bacterium]|nr:MAG: YaiO family outer membrane beta-barrel protein [Zetaproteobacteria bacterium]
MRWWLTIVMLLWIQAVWAQDASSPVQRARDLAKAGAYVQAERLLRQHLQEAPRDMEGRFLLARLLSWQGHYQQALAQYALLLRRDGQNADYLFGQAQVYTWMRDYPRALRILEALRARNPGYEDAWKLEWKILTTPGAEHGGVDVDWFRTEAAIAFPDRDWWQREQDTPSLHRHRQRVVREEKSVQRELEVGGSYSQLNNGFANWSSEYLAFRMKDAQDRSFHAMAENVTRYQLQDVQLTVGGGIPVLDWGHLFADLQFSPGHRFMPSSSWMGGALLSLPDGWGLQLGVRQTHYPESQTWTYSGMVERYFGNFRASYTFNWAQVIQAGNGSNHVLTLDHYYSTDNRLGVAYTVGKEVERISPTRVAITPVWNVTVHGRHWWNARWGTAWGLHVHHQGHVYNRWGGHVGLLYRF